MNRSRWNAVTVGIYLSLASSLSPVRAEDHAPGRVLVEFFPPPGSSACDPAAALRQELARAGVVPNRLLAVEWPSKLGTARREGHGPPGKQTNPDIVPVLLNGRPLPSSGPDRLAALVRAGRAKAEIPLELNWLGSHASTRRTLQVRVGIQESAGADHALLIGLALAVEHGAGDNSHLVVETSTQRSVQRGGSRGQTVTIPFARPEAGSGRVQVVAFVQDSIDGAILNAAAIAWPAGGEHPHPLAAKRGRPRTLPPLDPWIFTLQALLADPPACEDCGVPYSPEFLIRLPPVRFPDNKPDISAIKLPSC